MPDPSDRPDGSKGRMSPEDRAAFQRRVDELDDKLDRKAEKRRASEQSSGRATSPQRGYAYGFRMASELVAAVLLGGLIGYGLDYWLGTKPWLFLLFFLLGFAAGIMNLVRAYNRMQREIKAETGGYLGERVTDDDEDA